MVSCVRYPMHNAGVSRKERDDESEEQGQDNCGVAFALFELVFMLALSLPRLLS